jgi:hypothetical protein
MLQGSDSSSSSSSPSSVNQSGLGYSLLMKKKIDDGKKPIQQLVVIQELGTLLVTCDGKITALNLSTMAKQNNIIQGVKNCDYVAVNTKVSQLFDPIQPSYKQLTRLCRSLSFQGPLYRLAVAAKKKLLLFEYAQGYVIVIWIRPWLFCLHAHFIE